MSKQHWLEAMIDRIIDEIDAGAAKLSQMYDTPGQPPLGYRKLTRNEQLIKWLTMSADERASMADLAPADFQDFQRAQYADLVRKMGIDGAIRTLTMRGEMDNDARA